MDVGVKEQRLHYVFRPSWTLHLYQDGQEKIGVKSFFSEPLILIRINDTNKNVQILPSSDVLQNFN